MKKRRIVIASVLKPVNDTRMLEKMAATLEESGKYEVLIIGFHNNLINDYANIKVYPLPFFSRLSIGRLLAPWRVLSALLKIRPEILIVNTHELLFVAILTRIRFGAKIIYDIRENYYRNLLYTDAFPFPAGAILAFFVRLKETLTAPFFSHFFLAEEGYRREMSFFGSRATTLENKMVPTARVKSSNPLEVRLLFSGTLAESTGVFQAVRLAIALQAADPRIRLIIIGYCARPSVLEKLQNAIRPYPFIQLTGGEKLVPHPRIVDAIYSSDFGLIAYPPSRHTENSVPTKLYEYQACRLPILIQNHPPWVRLCEPCRAGIPLDFEAPDIPRLLSQMTGPFYTSEPRQVTWDSEGRKLVEALDTL